MVLHDLVAPQQLLNLVIAELSVVLLPHLLACSAHFWDGLIFPQYFVIFTLLNESPILHFAMWICLLLSFASIWSCTS